MLKTVNETASGTQTMCYRLKNLLKRLSDGWTIAATTSAAGRLLSIALLTESGTFHSKITEEDLNTLVEQDLLEGNERPGQRHLVVTNYVLKAA